MTKFICPGRAGPVFRHDRNLSVTGLVLFEVLLI